MKIPGIGTSIPIIKVRRPYLDNGNLNTGKVAYSYWYGSRWNDLETYYLFHVYNASVPQVFSIEICWEIQRDSSVCDFNSATFKYTFDILFILLAGYNAFRTGINPAQYS